MVTNARRSRSASAPAPRRLAPPLAAVAVAALALLGSCASGGATVSVQPGYFFGHDLRQAQSVVYVLDLSGSMRGGSGSVVENVGTDVAAKATGSLVGGFLGRRTGRVAEDNIKKLQQKVEKVKLHLIASLNGLPQGSQFNVVLFSSGVQKLSPVMVPVTPGTVALVSAFVARLEAGGSTSLGSAIMAGLHTGGNQVIILTDGLPTDASPQQILSIVARENYQRTLRVSTVGVGHDQDLSFLRQLAYENGGAFMSYD
jgi:Mg-chelatase subunit ChlD